MLLYPKNIWSNGKTFYKTKYVIKLSSYYRPQRSWGKVTFLHVSVILFSGGLCLSACCDTPPTGSRHPPEQTPPREQTPPPEQWQCMLGDTGNKRVVRILLECILIALFSSTTISQTSWSHTLSVRLSVLALVGNINKLNVIKEGCLFFGSCYFTFNYLVRINQVYFHRWSVLGRLLLYM